MKILISRSVTYLLIKMIKIYDHGVHCVVLDLHMIAYTGMKVFDTVCFSLY